jgi:hypothetical protein
MRSRRRVELASSTADDHPPSPAYSSARDMATLAPTSSMDFVTSPGSTTPKRSLEVPTGERADASERQLKRRKVELEQASFADATLLAASLIGSPSSIGEHVYLRGEVDQVLQWKRETQTASL